jgi:hypothetical protein
MKQFARNILVLGVIGAFNLGTINHSHGATYKVIDKGSAENLEYTYGKKQNNQGVMAVEGANVYNFPVQWSYLDDTDFNSINTLALTRHNYIYGLDVIEDFEALKAGNPSANDLAWAKLYLQQQSSSSANQYFEYQMVGDAVAMINLGAESENTEVPIFDTSFAGTNTLTRSTIDVIEGVSDSGVVFGTATAPYLPMEEVTDSNGNVRQHWLRAHGQRGFFAPGYGQEVIALEPGETRYGGGISAVFDMNANGVAVGYSSYKLSDNLVEFILDSETGCEEPNQYDVPYDICIQRNQSGMYYIQAYKWQVSSAGETPIATELGLLVEPNVDDKRAFTSQALAVNSHGIAVGYAHGWNSNDVTAPAVDERMSGSYAVIYKEDAEGNQQVFDFNQTHYSFNTRSVFPFSKAHDISDNGLVVGYTTNIDTSVKKFFYVDTNVPDDEMEIVTPKDFFTTSKSTAFAVNSNGVIVGEGEIETHNDSPQNPRRTAGFMFDTSNESAEIIDLNTLLVCDTPYSILKANDINDEGLISATAVVKSESFDAKGEAILDESGNPVLIDVVRAVLLEPIPGGKVDDCGATEDKVERQGASFSGVVIFALFALFTFRRRTFLK